MNWGASQAGEEPAFRPLKLDWRFELFLADQAAEATRRSPGGAGTKLMPACSRI